MACSVLYNTEVRFSGVWFSRIWWWFTESIAGTVYAIRDVRARGVVRSAGVAVTHGMGLAQSTLVGMELGCHQCRDTAIRAAAACMGKDVANGVICAHLPVCKFSLGSDTWTACLATSTARMHLSLGQDGGLAQPASCLHCASIVPASCLHRACIVKATSRFTLVAKNCWGLPCTVHAAHLTNTFIPCL